MDGPVSRSRATRRYPSPPTAASGIPSSGDRARDALLGGVTGAGAGNGYANGGAGAGAYTNEYLLEQHNNEYVEHLTGKMSLLREITLQIGDEVNSQNEMLSGMNESMTKTGSLLSSTIGRVGDLLKQGNNMWYCYFIVFVFVLFTMLYLWLKVR
ncbi:hypothetical protein M427DRAFT_124368 [Gonapodya prolifera JEL478]|uniref:t-SNARE coiled-coil homology domain-containing protein n=1 Tax=Gonapodya prolifera (strain JEL478) TaxID=1344416 RepID=A0A139ABY5_GONPJ|nr:hypothetical protein M427DRAFT_124368 [Gonapodya prolifera JEL478]|eukprot:KXS14280.1 hypothetical protein M427DRAFT_124368 [Gonapodya prolifera JEL478]